MRVIALSGRRKAGKDTVANMIKQSYPGWERVAFADAMKDMLSKDRGIPRWELDDDIRKEKHRQLMISYAEGLRAEDPEIFVREWSKRVEGKDRVIVSDLRRPPELHRLLRIKGSMILRIWAEDRTLQRRGVTPTKGVDDSDTETYMNNFPDSYFYTIGGAVIDNSAGKCLAGQVDILGRAFQW